MNEPNIEVRLTNPDEKHCFQIIFRVPAPDVLKHINAVDDRIPLEINLHTRQAFDLFNKLGSCLMDYFADRSEYLLEKLGVKK